MTILLRSGEQELSEFVHAYRVAGSLLLSQQPIALIEQFEVNCPANENVITDEQRQRLTIDYFDIPNARLIYQGQGSFSGGMKRVQVWEKAKVQLLRVGENDFSLTDLETGQIRLLNHFQSSQAESAEILLGPPLFALLAKQSIFCLHAGAVSTEHGAVVFIGESGRGKSTLSQSADFKSAREGTWSRLGDDIMPVTILEGKVVLLPRFPQLKRTRQHLDSLMVPLAAIFRLLEPATDNAIVCQKRNGSDALISLARHTAASRTFNEEALAKNMAFNQTILNRVPVYDLSYPRDFEQLEAVRNCITQQLIKKQS